jgi:hypothetical protein
MIEYSKFQTKVTENPGKCPKLGRVLSLEVES